MSQQDALPTSTVECGTAGARAAVIAQLRLLLQLLEHEPDLVDGVLWREDQKDGSQAFHVKVSLRRACLSRPLV